jgi:hypothetical protein
LSHGHGKVAAPGVRSSNMEDWKSTKPSGGLAGKDRVIRDRREAAADYNVIFLLQISEIFSIHAHASLRNCLGAPIILEAGLAITDRIVR